MTPLVVLQPQSLFPPALVPQPASHRRM